MNVYILELAKALALAGHQVDMYTRCQHESNPHVVNVMPNLRLVHVLAGPPASINKKLLGQYIPEFVRNLCAHVKANDLTYDILHCHYYLSGLIGLEINKRAQKKLPIVMSFHTLALMKNLVARDEVEKEELERIDAEKKLAQAVSSIIAPSQSDSEYLQYLYDTNPTKISVIPPGVDLNHFHPIEKATAKKKVKAEANEKIILFVGRIEPLKGLDLLLYAMKILVKRNPSIRLTLWIVGGDVSQDESEWSKQLKMLSRLRKILHIALHVKFISQQHQKDLPMYYNAAELVVMPSHYESFGIVALEAMACGIPVITTNVTGVSSLINTERQSLITSVNNPLLLASQIENLLYKPDERAAISKKLLQNVQQLDWKFIVKKIIRVYDTAISVK